MFSVKRDLFQMDEDICVTKAEKIPQLLNGSENDMDGSLPLSRSSPTVPMSESKKAMEKFPKAKVESSNHNHPLLHSLVLYNAFQYLPLEELLKCRLICTTWNAEACRLLRKNLTLEFQDICHISNFKQLMDESFEKKPDRDVPFAKINLRTTFRLGHEVAQDFFKVHGHIIKHIRVSKVGCDCGANFFQKLLFFQATNLTSLDLQIVSSPIRLSPISEYTEKYVRVKRVPKRLPHKWRLPNLTRIHLRHQLVYERPKLIEDLLEAAVNLETLTTDEANPMYSRNCFVPAVLASRNRFIKLRKIQVGDMLCISNQDMLTLAERNLQLDCLPLNFNILVPTLETLNMNNLMILLTSLQNSMKRLELVNHRPDILSDFKSFPRMKQLQYLKMTNVHFPSKFLDKLPNLRSLYVAHEEATLYGSFFKLNISPHPSLSNFGLYHPLSSMNIAHLRSWMEFWQSKARSYINELATSFPYLRILSISGNDEVMKSIYEKLPLLEELKIYGPITDEGITGIANSKCQQMCIEQDYGILDADELDEIKFIGDLSNLKRLTVSSLGTGPMLTEVSVFLGFICCRDLVDLDVGNKHLTDLWKQEVERMRGHSKTS